MRDPIPEYLCASVHIFGCLQGEAVDNHFIYLEIYPEQDFTTFFERIESKQRFSRKMWEIWYFPLRYRVINSRKERKKTGCY